MAEPSRPRRVAIIGAGLLGGSVAMSLRRRFAQVEIVALARSESKRQAVGASGVFDEVFDSVARAVDDCDVVVVATPVDRIVAIVCQVAEASPPDCLITDVGSTKAAIVAGVGEHSLARDKFVAAHPIAGSEKTGLEHSLATLFDDKLVVLTPEKRTPADLLRRAVEFWQATGGRTLQMSAAEHDAHLAAVSHVPHLVSCVVALQAGVHSRPLVGSGWRDITRVAAGDPEMWTAICKENRQAIARELSRVRDSLGRLGDLIDAADDEGLYRWLVDAQQARHLADH